MKLTTVLHGPVGICRSKRVEIIVRWQLERSKIDNAFLFSFIDPDLWSGDCWMLFQGLVGLKSALTRSISDSCVPATTISF